MTHSTFPASGSLQLPALNAFNSFKESIARATCENEPKPCYRFSPGVLMDMPISIRRFFGR